MLNDIIRFKIHVQGSLEAYEEFVAQEAEREFEEQAAAAGAGAGAAEPLIGGEEEEEDGGVKAEQGYEYEEDVEMEE